MRQTDQTSHDRGGRVKRPPAPLAARRPEWLTPARAQLECELRGLVAMLADEDVDALIDVGLELWVASSRRCVADRDAPGSA
jgi:hypothetical protein